MHAPNSYLQCMATQDDNFKVQQFINYLGANTDADEWFDELPHKEREDLGTIKHPFYKRWLKEKEVISI